MEIWKPIPTEPNYEVSNFGNVRRSRGGRGARSSRLLTSWQLPTGYTLVHLSSRNRTTTHLVHRLVAQAFIGPIPEGMEVNHINSNKRDNRPENLEYVTRSQNLKHAVDRGVYRGENNHQAKLTEEQVKTIRSLHASGYGYKRLAKQFFVTWGAIRDIVKRRNWTHC